MEEELTEWFDPDEVPAHIGFYEWEGLKENVFWGGKHWRLLVGPTLHCRTEAIMRWRGLVRPTLDYLLGRG
jgi:hypothetical protein